MSLLLLHLAATLFMVGVIWFVQVVHYPLFAEVGASHFPGYQAGHMRRTSWVVMPAMLLEAATGLLLALRPPPGPPAGALWLGVALLALIWGTTAVAQVPRHRSLAVAFDAGVHSALVAGNWLRTALWSLRGALVLWLASRL